MIVVKRKFAVGLASYLCQAALSLDRIPFEDMTPLIEFNKTLRYSLQDALARLSHINNKVCHENRFAQWDIPWTCARRRDYLATIGRICTLREIAIRDVRLWFVERALRHYEQLLADKSKWSRMQFVDVRLEIAYSCSMITPLIHPRFSREAVYKVDHLNHAEHLKVKSVEEIAGNDWLGG